ncbi:MAG: YIP1 family protein [Desulfobacterota bacterium]|nr:YIP1 family protein [Thermodesulfobacteriota bacterium]
MGLYKVVFLGLKVAGPEEEARLLQGLQKRFNLTPEKAENLLQRVPIVVKKGISREEMEKYVRAFEEIGGKVRVEEMPSEDLPGISIEPEPPPQPKPAAKPEPKPYTGPMVTCPQCGHQQPDTGECFKCGLVISKYMEFQEMARSIEGQVREISTEEKVSPWESGEGFLWAYLRTTREALFSPTAFFKKVSSGEGYWSPLIYGIICGVIGVGLSMVIQWFFFSALIPPQLQAFIPFNLLLGLSLIGIPLMVGSSIFIGSAITHLCLIIVGGNRKGFQTTFRVISYSYCGQLFNVVPFIGNLIASVYMIVLIIIGVREGHRITTGKAAFAVLLPLIVIFGLGILAAVMIPIFLGGLGLFRGVGV